MDSNETLIALAVIAAVALLINAYFGYLSLKYAHAASLSSKANTEKLTEVVAAVQDVTQAVVDTNSTPPTPPVKGAKK